MGRQSRWAGVILFLALAVQSGSAQEITVAAASDLQFAIQDVAARFQKETGKKINLIFGSSGNFFTQIQNGAPFDLFFSADIEYPQKLEAAGLAEPGTLYRYAAGKIVLWAPNGSKLDLSRGLQVLLDPRIRKIAIANPAHAPYGRAAVAALRYEKLYDPISTKLALGENISQTASFVVAGSADVGIVALSLALAPSLRDKGRYVEIPVDEYPPLEQAAVILKSSQNKETARQFVAFMKTPPILDLLRTYGFSVPSGVASGK
ncbi:MAG TPA: molybdate ABC transporter substrate-binding protein [Terriglobales bacterium]|jgi:molybdate transport system substrate-binding protein|nr:molybdate ABC transporter substrate-binding protein [Terriglobales bacterium]